MGTSSRTVRACEHALAGPTGGSEGTRLVLAVMNPPHLMMGDRQLLRTVVTKGIPLVFASDNAMNPYQNLSYATAYPRNKAEAITMEEAVIAYTRMGAYSEFKETEKGSLETGKAADLTVLSQNLFELAPEKAGSTQALLTMVAGRIVYAREPFKRER